MNSIASPDVAPRPRISCAAPRWLAAGAALLALAGCAKKEEPVATGPEPIKVGMYMDLSGQTSSFGESSVSGAEMAVEEINAAGGVLGRPIQLVVEDDQGRPEQAATVVTKLIDQDKVVALIGEVASTNSLAAAPIAQRSKVPMITPSSTNPRVTETGDYIFRVCFIDPFQGEVVAKFARQSLGAKTAAILYDNNSDYSRGLTQFFRETFTKAGGRIVEEQSYAQTDRDFSGQLTAIRARKPDAVFVPGYYNQVGVIIKQAHDLGIKAALLGADGWDAPQIWDLAGEAINGSYMSNHYSVDDPSPAIRAFVEKYRNSHRGNAPEAMAVLAYDALNVLATAMTRAGTVESEKLRDAIAATKDFPGVSGTISLNEQRNAIKQAIMLELRDRRYVYKETIYPEGMMPPPAPAAEPAPAAPPGT